MPYSEKRKSVCEKPPCSIMYTAVYSLVRLSENPHTKRSWHSNVYVQGRVGTCNTIPTLPTTEGAPFFEI